MKTQETDMHPLEALEAAEREYLAGNYVKSSRILWKATEATFTMMAKAHGLNASDPLDVAKVLDRKHHAKDPYRPYYYSGYLISGMLLQAHAEMEALEDYELDGPHRGLPPFIRKCYREFSSDDVGQ